MLTQNKPTHCPECESQSVYLGSCDYKKDADGLSTDIIVSGSWFCKECGTVIGSFFKGINDINKRSL